MSFMKQHYHELLVSDDDEQCQYEEMAVNRVISEAAEICANDVKAFELLIRKLHSLRSE